MRKPELLLKSLSVLLIVMFPVGLLIMLTPFGRQYLWTTSIFLFLQGLLLFILLYYSAGFTKSITASIILLALSFVIEYLAVKTSYPFGSYLYTDVLQPVLNGVPLAIAFAWFSVIVSSYIVVANLYPGVGAFAICFISSVIIFATDIMLEPFASFVNGFWLWEGSRVPMQNFISWWVLGFLFSLILSIFAPPVKVRSENLLINKIPYLIIIINILNFSIINIYSGYVLISIAGLIIIGSVTLLIPGLVKNEA